MENISLNISTYTGIFSNLYSKTDSDWFENLTGKGNERIYKFLPIQTSLKDNYFSSKVERIVKKKYEDSPQLYPCIFIWLLNLLLNGLNNTNLIKKLDG